MVQRFTDQAALVWLLLALVVVPTLGRWHQISHGGALDRVHAGRLLAPAFAPTTPAATQARSGTTATAIHRVLDRLLGPHTSADCLLLDQLALSNALHTTVVVVPAVAPVRAAPMPPTDGVGVWHVALFQARGPPAV